MTTDGAFIRAEKYHRIDRNERPVLTVPAQNLVVEAVEPVRPSPPRVPSALAHDDLDASFINAFLTDPERQENFSRACWITVRRAGMLQRLDHILADLAQHSRSRGRGRRRMQDAFARQMLRQRRPLALEASPRIFSAAAAAAASCACVSACEKARELTLQLFEDGTALAGWPAPQPEVAKVRVGMGHAAQAVLVRGAPA